MHSTPRQFIPLTLLALLPVFSGCSQGMDQLKAQNAALLEKSTLLESRVNGLESQLALVNTELTRVKSALSDIQTAQHARATAKPAAAAKAKKPSKPSAKRSTKKRK